MTFAKGVLSTIAAISVALLGPGLWIALRGIASEKATGVAAVAGGFVAALVSPLFWILAIVTFAIFFATSRFHNKLLSFLFFWIPTLMLSALGFLFFVLFVYITTHTQRG
jgi:hypothetical protein